MEGRGETAPSADYPFLINKGPRNLSHLILRQTKPMPGKGLFISGTDTGVGKTYVAHRLIRTLREKGYKVAAMKPVASGCEQQNGMLVNSDALALNQETSLDFPYALVNPYAFEPAIAPHIAAAQVGVVINFEIITQAYNRLAAQVDYVIVEGAGGWLVPLGPRYAMADLAAHLQLPVLLVACCRLGWLNHSLLSAQAIMHSGCRLSGIVANQCEATAMPYYAENLSTLRGCLPTRSVLELGYLCSELVWPPQQNIESLF